MNENLIYITCCDSTNKEAFKHLALADVNKPIALYTSNQRAGKGQGEHIWISEANNNITISFIFKFNQWTISKHFVLSQCFSLAILQFLRSIQADINPKIKWPNDIIVDSKKMAGILIENIFEGEYIQYSILGVGINVNQKDFGPSLPNAGSLSLVTGKDWELDPLINRLFETVKESMIKFQSLDSTVINKMYNEALFKKNELATIKINNISYRAMIEEVASDGKLKFSIDGKKTEIFHHEGQIILDNE